MIYLQLLWSFFQIGLFSIGGGYAAMPLIQHQVVDLHPWLTMTEFADIMTIAEMTPGPIAINSATFVGIQVAGIPGAVIATLGCVLPSCIIVMLLAYIYYRFKGLSMVQGVLFGLRPAVVATIHCVRRPVPADPVLLRQPHPAGGPDGDPAGVGTHLLRGPLRPAPVEDQSHLGHGGSRRRRTGPFPDHVRGCLYGL